MTYVNQDMMLGVRTRLAPPEKRKAEKLLSLAMSSFVDPTVHRLYKVKAPLKSASSVFFCPSRRNSMAGDLQRSGGLIVADLTSGKIVQLSGLDGRYCRDLASYLDPQDMCTCGPDCLAVVDSNEWGSCVKVVSLDTGDVLTTWGRQLSTWTARAIANTRDGNLVVSNIHPEASSRLMLFTPDGREVILIIVFYMLCFPNDNNNGSSSSSSKVGPGSLLTDPTRPEP